MNTTNPITIELLMRERMNDRLFEADHERLVSQVRQASAPSSLTAPIAAMAIAFARLASGAF